MTCLTPFSLKVLNGDATIDGILVQLPLPSHMNLQRVIEMIAVEKDVDGFHALNVGLLAVGSPLFHPCTPYGILHILKDQRVHLEGAEVVLVGASNIVGKPMAAMMLAEGATVTVCHIKTKDLASHTRRADVLVVAAGKAGLISADMVKPGAVVIDVGINRKLDGRLCGDVDFNGVSQVASAITPVPGGVGPMTIAMLLANTVAAAERKLVY